MTPRGPSRVQFSGHAANRCRQFDRPPVDVAEIVLANHAARRRNPGPADWLVESDRLVIAYNWPDHGDPEVATVVTLWPQR